MYSISLLCTLSVCYVHYQLVMYIISLLCTLSVCYVQYQFVMYSIAFLLLNKKKIKFVVFLLSQEQDRLFEASVET